VAFLALSALTVAVFSPVLGFGFLHWDDGVYVVDNEVVRQGLTLKGLGWSFNTGAALMWHPLTWFSHMMDVQIFGMPAGGHHATNLILHLLSTLLLFGFLRRATASLWRSAALAALFAVHPLHVESVAWVAERKDVLSGLFWMLLLVAYLAYVRRPAASRYVAVLVLFGLGLMAKPMLVTAPLVLLLLDYWPLGRVAGPRPRSVAARLLLEKVPLLVASAAAALVTLLAESHGGAISGLELLPVGRRIGNVAVAYVLYLWKTIVPTGLVFLYPYPRDPRPLWVVAGAALLLAAATWIVFVAAGRRPWLLVGWLWYLLTLFPVSGIVQVGPHAMADRYTYIPLIGLFIMLSFALPRGGAASLRRKLVTAASLAVIAALGVAARTQVGYWRDDFALFNHAVQVNPGNWVAQNNLGLALVAQGLVTEAVSHFEASAQANPGYALAWNNLGLASFHGEHIGEAESYFRRAVQVDPAYAEARGNLGSTLLREGRVREALEELEAARRLDPENAVTLNNLASAWYRLGNLDRAEELYGRALELKPGYASPRLGLEAVRKRRGLPEPPVRTPSPDPAPAPPL